jgi:hypothetical protein
MARSREIISGFPVMSDAEIDKNMLQRAEKP